ncbi:mediator-associated protein 1 [Cucumis melo var. makuwa]|uniref:Mediator-associated protein 1 n=2 Tax=Cucumis melo TaxID=3656 RepID=A0A5D3CG03_CUCMM|nr:mediator-associated protein 1 [Cucumis melo var. makuwa]
MDPRNDAVFPDEDLEDDEESLDDDDDDEEEEELNDEPSPSTSSAGALPVPSVSATVTIATPPAVSVVPPPSIVSISSADLIRQRLETATAEPLTLQGEKKPLDESRKLFQRLWTDEDEIELLQGFLDYTMQRGTTHHHQNDTALFYDQIKSKLQLDFNKNQLVEKLRRLKKKYRNVIGKISSGKDFNFKSPHDQATFEISRKIWSNTGRIGVDDNALDDDEPAPTPYASYMDHRNEEMMANCAEKKPTPTPKSRKRSRPGSGIRMEAPRSSHENLNKEKNSIYHHHHNNNNANNNANNNENVNNVAVAGLIEETVKSCLSPLFKELLNTSMGGGLCGGRGFSGLALHPIPLNFSGASMNFSGGLEMADERWRKQQILELEVYSKRLELVQEQIKTALEDLRKV